MHIHHITDDIHGNGPRGHGDGVGQHGPGQVGLDTQLYPDNSWFDGHSRMQYPVGHIKIGFDTFPEKDEDVDQQPSISFGFQEFSDFPYKVFAEQQGRHPGGHDAGNQTGQAKAKGDQQPENQGEDE